MDEDGYTQYKLDPNYYPVTIDKTHLTFNVENNGHSFDEPFETCRITITKRIPVNELDGRIWFEHGTPSFVIELKQEATGRIYRHSYTFTEDYVAANTVNLNGKKYVEMSYTWIEMEPGEYTATEKNTVRYTLVDIKNI